MRRFFKVLVCAALVPLLAGCVSARPTFTVGHVPRGHRVALYDASTGRRLSVSAAARRNGVVTVPLPGERSSGVFALCTGRDAASGCGVASRAMTVSSGQRFSYRAWRDAARSGKADLYFDDAAWSVWRNGRALLREFGIQSRIAVVTASSSATRAGTPENGTMSWAQIADMAQDGHAIVSHTRTHRNLRHLDDRTLEAELRDSLADLRRRGYETSEIVYPYGAFDDRVVAAARRHYRHGRGSIGLNDASTDPFRIATQDTRDGAAAVAVYIDETVNSGKWLTLMYHGVDTERLDAKSGAYLQAPYDVHPNVLRAELAYLVASGVSYPVLVPRKR